MRKFVSPINEFRHNSNKTCKKQTMLIFGYFIVLTVSILLSIGWLRLNTNLSLNSESFRDSTKVGITITTLAFPLMIGSTDYFDKRIFWHIIATISISTFLGLWNSFSIATVTDGDGKINVGPDNNKALPFIQVMQFFFMIYAIILSLVYAEKPVEKESIKEIIVVQPNLLINKSKENLIDYLGLPNASKKILDTTFFYYSSKKSIITFKIFNDTIIEKNDRVLRPKY